MVELSNVLARLKEVGYRPGFFQRAEVKELCKVLHEDETIYQATNGYYEGGFSLLVATDHRLLLIDRKPMFLTLDSIAYSMIQEVSFNYRLFNSTIHIFTSNKCLDFNSWNHSQIRAILTHTQQAMRTLRSNQTDKVYSFNDDDRQSLDGDIQKVEGLDYERLSVPEQDLDTVPIMPQPYQSSLNPNSLSAYGNSSITINTLPVAPIDLNTDNENASQRHYARRYY